MEEQGGSPDRLGSVIAGKYRVDRVLGRGGMGLVVAATHIELRKRRAIKFMLPEALPSAEAAERFLQEARAAAQLTSEHVAKVHDVGRLEDGAPYMVMEHLDGSDLHEILLRRGRVDPGEAVHYALQACEALAEAHAKGIVHRDLKPANLFLTRATDGSPCIKVLDFGISKWTAVTAPGGAGVVTSTTAAPLGSPLYMSPEQVRGERSIDPRADIWALGVVLYELVTGRAPYRGRTLGQILAMVIETTPPPPSSVSPEVPAELDDVILRCMAKRPEGRFASVAELAAALVPVAPEAALPLVSRIDRVLHPRPSDPPRSAPRSSRPTPPSSRPGGGARRSEPPADARSSPRRRYDAASEALGAETPSPPSSASTWGNTKRRRTVPPLRAKAQLAAWWIAGILGAANLVAIVWGRIHPETDRVETIAAPAAAQPGGNSAEMQPSLPELPPPQAAPPEPAPRAPEGDSAPAAAKKNAGATAAAASQSAAPQPTSSAKAAAPPAPSSSASAAPSTSATPAPAEGPYIPPRKL